MAVECKRKFSKNKRNNASVIQSAALFNRSRIPSSPPQMANSGYIIISPKMRTDQENLAKNAFYPQIFRSSRRLTRTQQFSRLRAALPDPLPSFLPRRDDIVSISRQSVPFVALDSRNSCGDITLIAEPTKPPLSCVMIISAPHSIMAPKFIHHGLVKQLPVRLVFHSANQSAFRARSQS